MKILTLVAILFSLCLAGQVPAPAAPRLTADQAIQIAKQFCQAIGEPVTEVGVAQFPVPDSLDTPKHYWQPRWYVEFTGQATVEVVDSTGVIAFYYNDALERQVLSQPVGQAIAQSDAIANATTAIQATGQNGDIAFDAAQEFLLGETAARHQWLVGWTRTYGIYSYQHQGVNVELSAETGRVRSLSVNFGTPPPLDANLVVTEEVARNIAISLLSSAGLAITEGHMHLLISRPNTFWQDGNEDELSVLPVLTWVYWFVEPGPRTGEVHIDAQTGQIVGGYEEGYRGGGGAAPKIPFGKLNLKAFKPGRATKSVTPPVSPLKETALRQALASAEQVTLASATKSGAAVTTLSAQSNPKMLALLGKTTAWQGAKPAGAKVYRLTLTEGGTTRELTLFSSNVGLVGKGSEWYTVPTAFNAWVRTLGAPKTGK